MSEQDQINGHLMRGAEGKLYFIPHDELASFQVPEDRVAQVEAMTQDNVGSEVQEVCFFEASLQAVAQVQVPRSAAAGFMQVPPE